MKTFAVTMTVIIVSSLRIEARPNGAPKGICKSQDFTPRHYTNQAVGPLPYVVNVSENTEAGYIPGKKYNIQLIGTEVDSDFRGFIIQAIRCGDNSSVGTFIEPTDEDSQYKLQCGGSVATHNDREDKESVQIGWTAPPCGTTNCVMFRYTFVDVHAKRKKGQSRFWANERTPPIYEARCVIDGQECVETCVTACPPTCENPEPKSCTAECIVGCQCPNGTVLDEENNKCVMKKDCGCPVKGQVRMECAPPANCAKTCDNYDLIQACPPECGNFDCMCPNGTVIDEDKNECVEQSECPDRLLYSIHECQNSSGHYGFLAYRQSVKCTVEGQEFTMCGTACHPTCDAPNPEPCTKQCIIGCQCPRGLILDEENNKCVMKKDCACPIKGQIRIECAPLTICAATCSNNGVPRPCPRVCDDYGCVCPNGTVLDEDNNECIDASECPVKCAVEGQEFTLCGTACHPTCDAPNPESCTKQCIIGCQCPRGLILDEENNKCVMKKDCACPVKGQIRIECAPLTICAATCSNNGVPRPCPRVCDDYGCVCPNGTVLDEDNNECIDASECPGLCIFQRIRGRVKYDRENKTATLKFSVRDETAITECSLDDGDFSNCTNPVMYTNLRRGRHTITVRATCPGNGDSGSKRFRFRVRRR
ncbi:matrilin-2-like isoform X3 [Dysidea avara]